MTAPANARDRMPLPRGELGCGCGYCQVDPNVRRAHERAALFARVDVHLYTMDDASLEIMEPVARALAPLPHADLRRVLAYVQALASAGSFE